MSAARPEVTDFHHLGAEEAEDLWQWVLARQGLGPGRQLTTVPAIATATLGLHSARLPSPYATVLARAAHPDVAMSLWDEQTHRELVTLRCMRKTLHALPLGLAGAAHAATLHYRRRDVLRHMINAGVSVHLVTILTTAIEQLLSEHGHLTHRQIEERIAGSGATVRASGSR